MADTKVRNMTNDASPTGDDLVYVINDPAGTPGDRKVSLANLAAYIAGTGTAVTSLPSAAGNFTSTDTMIGTEAGSPVQFTVAQTLAGAYIPGGTDVAVADGGTGSSTAAGARTNLGLTLGTLADFALVPTAVKTTTYAAAANELVVCDTTSGAFTVTLPNAPADGTRIAVKAVLPTSAPNLLTVVTHADATASGGATGTDTFNRASGATLMTLPLVAQGTMLQYKASSTIWFIVGSDLPLSQLDLRYALLSGATFTGETVHTDVKVSGITGSVSGGRFVGFTASGAPSTGAHLVGDVAYALDGHAFLCTVAATPGTWVEIGTGTFAKLAGAAFTGDVSVASGTPGGKIVASTGAFEHRNNTADTNPSSVLSDFATLGAISLGPGGATAVTLWALYSTLASGILMANTRISKRVTTTNAPGATPTLNTDTTDVLHLTGVAAAITSMTTNLTGTPNQGDTLRVDITDNGTARAITWGASFEASGTIALPTTTVISTRLDVGFIWNTVTSKWRCVGVA